MNVQLIIFYVFATLVLFTSMMVITSKNPVRGVLFLVAAFVSSSVLWLLLESEFLALVLIFVYVGAVMTLFLFVVMMINIDLAPFKEGFVRYLPIGLLVMVIMVGAIFYVIQPKHYVLGTALTPLMHDSNYSNVKELGGVLYTTYVYPFEIAAALLLVSIIAAISLAFRGRQNSKSQRIEEQIAIQRKDRVYLTDLK